MVNIDTVYQRVLALANKEQRGYITPKEFNLFANHAQMDIFEQYFYDLNQFRRLNGNDTMYADPVDMLEEKIEIFHRGQTLTDDDDPSNIFDTNDLNNELYRLKQVIFNNTTVVPNIAVKVEKTTHDKFQLSIDSPLTRPTLMRPIYHFRNSSIVVSPNTITSVDVNYIKKPQTVQWASTMVDGVAMYNADLSVHFELHPSEETELVLKILSLSGVTIKDPGLYQIASGEDIKNIQQEKQ